MIKPNPEEHNFRRSHGWTWGHILHLLLCSNRQLFWPSNVPVFQIKVFIKVLIGCDGRGVIYGGTLRSEVLLSQKLRVRSAWLQSAAPPLGCTCSLHEQANLTFSPLCPRYGRHSHVSRCGVWKLAPTVPNTQLVGDQKNGCWAV